MENKCKTCKGFGMWGIGLFTSMGPSDAASGMPTLPCPECGKNANPLEKVTQKENRKKDEEVI